VLGKRASERSEEGIRLTWKGMARIFRGSQRRVMFLSMRTEAGPPAKTPIRDTPGSADPQTTPEQIREDVVSLIFGEAKTRKRRREPGEIALGLAYD